MSDPPILVTGAAGKTGLAVIRALARLELPVRAFVRSPEQEALVFDTGASETVTLELDPRAFAYFDVGDPIWDELQSGMPVPAHGDTLHRQTAGPRMHGDAQRPAAVDRVLNLLVMIPVRVDAHRNGNCAGREIALIRLDPGAKGFHGRADMNPVLEQIVQDPRGRVVPPVDVPDNGPGFRRVRRPVPGTGWRAAAGA